MERKTIVDCGKITAKIKLKKWDIKMSLLKIRFSFFIFKIKKIIRSLLVNKHHDTRYPDKVC